MHEARQQNVVLEMHVSTDIQVDLGKLGEKGPVTVRSPALGGSRVRDLTRGTLHVSR